MTRTRAMSIFWPRTRRVALVVQRAHGEVCPQPCTYQHPE